MAWKVIYKPVLDSVWYVETNQFLEERWVSDSIKGFTEIEGDYNNIWLFSEEVGNCLEKEY